MAITLKYRKASGDGVNDRDNADVDVDENTGAITTSAANLSVGLRNVLIEVYEDGNEFNSVIRPVTFEVVPFDPFPALSLSGSASPGSGAYPSSQGGAKLSNTGAALSALQVGLDDPNFAGAPGGTTVLNPDSGELDTFGGNDKLGRAIRIADLTGATTLNIRVSISYTAGGTPPYGPVTLYVVCFDGAIAASNKTYDMKNWTPVGSYTFSGSGNFDIALPVSAIQTAGPNQNIGLIAEDDYNDSLGNVPPDASFVFNITSVYST